MLYWVEAGLSKDFQIHTYGCKVNTYDSGLLQDRFYKAGYKHCKESRVHVLNTCAVTAEASNEALREIRRIKAKDPLSTIVVTGCAAQVDTDKFQIPGADLVVANSHKGKLEEILEDYFKGKSKQKVFHSNIFKKEDLEAGGGLEESHTRAFLKIQDGCNSFCTYCVIPFARGKSRSVPISQLIDKINSLYEKGIREVVLTGVHIGDYASRKDHKEILAAARGRKSPEKFHYLEAMLRQVLENTSMPRFRLGSLEPQELTDELMELYQNPRFCPHFHMSIQAAESQVLKDMKRNYDAQEVEKALLKIDKELPHAFVGMDVIAGFPSETEARFSEGYQRLAALPWTRIHVFPYSERPGTKAADWQESVERSIRKERAKKLRALSAERFAEKALNQLQKTKKVLLLKAQSRALSRDFWQIQLTNTDQLKGLSHLTEYKVKVHSYDHSLKNRMTGLLLGEVIVEQ